MFITPKIDWKATDYYNFEDLNRVENNTEVVATLVHLYFKQTNIAINKIRDMRAIEFSDSLNRIEGNIDVLKNNFYTPLQWENPKTNWKAEDSFSYEDANRLEKNLLALFNLVHGTVDNFYYCGAYTCGEGGI